MKRYSTLFLIAFARVASACLNTYESNELEAAHSDNLVAQLTDHHLREQWTVARDRLKQKLKVTPTFEVQNDLAVALLHTGDTTEAISLLTQVETEHPGAYQTASNLGTAYELAGDNANALKWIQEGIRRNPKSHGGSEWIHVGILQAKISIAADPEWLNTHSPLGLEVSHEDKWWIASPDSEKNNERLVFWSPSPVLPKNNEGRVLSISQCIAALRIQLHERLQFTPKPNPLVGILIGDYANLLGKKGETDASLRCLYRLAEEYAPGHPERFLGQYSPARTLPPWWIAESEAIRTAIVVLLTTLCGSIAIRKALALWRARSKNS